MPELSFPIFVRLDGEVTRVGLMPDGSLAAHAFRNGVWVWTPEVVEASFEGSPLTPEEVVALPPFPPAVERDDEVRKAAWRVRSALGNSSGTSD